MELNLRDKRVLVTGGNGGLGAAMAEGLRRRGRAGRDPLS